MKGISFFCGTNCVQGFSLTSQFKPLEDEPTAYVILVIISADLNSVKVCQYDLFFMMVLTIRENLAKYEITSGLFCKWTRQLAVGVNAILHNTKPLKSPDLLKLEEENRKLKEFILKQSVTIMNPKKEMYLDSDLGVPWKNRKRTSSILSDCKNHRDRSHRAITLFFANK
jgi:hypothetical protein